ncbi:hypothetical protein G9A89_002496 [Geosiphon pyriformis]|nr:hypothetical protein G9A89_002496 [Geosiphon pyriformis]
MAPLFSIQSINNSESSISSKSSITCSSPPLSPARDSNLFDFESLQPTSSMTPPASPMTAQTSPKLSQPQLYAFIKHSDINNDPTLQRVVEAVNLCCESGDPNTLQKLMFTVIYTIEKNLHDHQSPLYGTPGQNKQSIFGTWRAPLNARVGINFKIKPIEDRSHAAGSLV